MVCCAGAPTLFGPQVKIETETSSAVKCLRTSLVLAIMTEGPTALKGTTMSEVFDKHLDILHAARRAFIASESSARLRKALNSKIRTGTRGTDMGKQFEDKEQRTKWMREVQPKQSK
jgi:hypothetical protein